MTDSQARASLFPPETFTREQRVEIDRLRFFWRLAFKNRSEGYPDVLDWTPLSSGDSMRHTDADFTVDGQRFAVRWEYRRSGWDTADWDDGWWPKFYAIVSKRRGLVPWPRETRVQVYWSSGKRTLEGQLAELTA